MIDKPVINKHFDLDLKFGIEKENYLQAILEGQIEVKTDRLVSKTGNIVVEYEYNGKPSGLNVTTAPYWAFILEGELFKSELIIIIKTDRLRELCNESSFPSVYGGDRGASRMYLIPVRELFDGKE